MRFGNTYVFWILLWAMPVLGIFYVWSALKSDGLMKKFAQKDLVSKIAPLYSRRIRNWRILLDLAAVLFLATALARPQWGYRWVEEELVGLDIVFALDTSRSMLARDMSPDRLSFAKTEIRDFMRKLDGDRFGLIAFAGEAFLQCPLTTDHRAFLLSLEAANENSIPVGGTAIPEAINEAIKTYEGAVAHNRILILITDGENTAGSMEEATKKAKEAGIMISAIGIGSSKGSKIPLLNEAGEIEYVKDSSGEKVISRLEEDALRKMTDDTGGIYVRASQTRFGLDAIYDEKLKNLEQSKTEDRKKKVYTERFQYFLTIAFLLLLTEIFLRGKGEDSKNS